MDKVTQDEIRAERQPAGVLNSVWDGTTIKLFGAKNEVISFNVVLEAARTSAKQVSVTLSDLTSSTGSVLRYASRPKTALFDWTQTESELFYVRYLQINGLSKFVYGALAPAQEKTFPKRAQCITGSGCAWTARPVANKFYPDIAVPIELVPTFSVVAPGNQSIWADIYIPKTVASGKYVGSLTVREQGTITRTIPISLQVRNFSLPDVPTSKTMLDTNYGDLLPRYGSSSLQAMAKQLLVAHRHKISIIDDNMGASWTGGMPHPNWVPFLTGTGFNAANGYAGPGVGVGNNVFSIGTYGGLTTTTTEAGLHATTNAWETWFQANSPSTERFLYLCDESACNNSPNLATLLGWSATNTGIGRYLQTMATVPLIGAPTALNIPASVGSYSIGTTADYQAAVDSVLAAAPQRSLIAYASTRPAEGSVAIEDEGTSLRELPWGQFKKRVSRWFLWEATYYRDNQNGRGDTDVFKTAETFGGPPSFDPSYGMIGSKSSNGEGVLFYPGTDNIFPNESYGINGPIASLRLKFWRRGIQDIDYIKLAQQINPSAVAAIVQQMVPKVLWEIQCDNLSDCSYTTAPISWSKNPDDWEAARLKLANIIDPTTSATPGGGTVYCVRSDTVSDAGVRSFSIICNAGKPISTIHALSRRAATDAP